MVLEMCIRDRDKTAEEGEITFCGWELKNIKAVDKITRTKKKTLLYSEIYFMKISDQNLSESRRQTKTVFFIMDEYYGSLNKYVV